MSPYARTGLVSALLFGMAFGVARWKDSSAGLRRSIAIQSSEAVARTQVAEGNKLAEASRAIPQWHDELLKRALDGRDLVGAVREIMAKQQDDHCADTRIFALVESLPAGRLRELPGLLEAFHADPYVHKFVLRAWAQRDAAGALNYIETHPEHRAKHLPDLMEGWTQREPQAALAWLDGKHSATEAASLRTAVLGTIANTDPAQALELLQSKGWLAQSPQLLTQIMQSYGAVKPTEALQAMRSMLAQLKGKGNHPYAASQNFEALYRAMLNGLWQVDPASAEAVARQLTPEEQAMGKFCFAEEVTMRTPGGIEQLLRGPLDQETVRSLISSHGRELLEHFSELPDDEMRKKVINESSDSIRTLSPAVLAFIEQMPATERESILQNLVTRMASGNTADALPLWRKLSPEGQSAAGPLLFKKYAAESPDLVLGELRKCPEAVQVACLRGVCVGLVAEHPQTALDLALMQTDPALQVSCLAGVFGFWSNQSEADAIKAMEAHAPRLDLSALLTALPSAGQFKSGSGSTTYNIIKSTALQNRIRELLKLPSSANSNASEVDQ